MMKSRITKSLALAAAVFGLQAFTNTAMAEQMYYNRLSTGTDVVPAGTYGDITVPGLGYGATKFTDRSSISQTTGDYGGAYTGIIDSTTRIQTHTISAWVKVPYPSSGDSIIFAPRSKDAGSTHAGYKIAVDSNGALWVGKTDTYAWQGAKFNSANGVIPNGEWCYLTVAITKTADKTGTVAVYKNGESVSMTGTTMEMNLNGQTCGDILVGPNVAAAGVYVDTTAVSDTATIKSWATNSTYVKPLLSNAYLWLDASDSSTITKDSSGNVTSWASKNTGGKSATSYSTSPVTAGPTVLQGALDGKNVVDFGAAGSNKDLKFDSSSTIRTVFMVADVATGTQNVFFLGGSSTYQFHRGDSGTYFESSHGSRFLGGTYCDGIQVSNPQNVQVPSGYHLYTLVANSDATSDRICQDRTQSGRNGGKKIAELIIFNKALTDDARTAVEQYLKDKWLPTAKTYTATFSADKTFSELDTEWSPSKPAGGFRTVDILKINNTASAKLTIDQDIKVGTFKIENTSGNVLTLGFEGHTINAALDISGSAEDRVKIDVSGVPGAEIAKYAVAGAPYSYWYISGSGQKPDNPTTMPTTLPAGYSATAEKYAGYGMRLVVTAPNTAKYGAVSVNVYNSKKLSDSAMIGVYPVLGSSWGYQKDATAVTQDGITFTPYISSGTFATEDGNSSAYTGGIPDSENGTTKYLFAGFCKDHNDTTTVGYTLTGLSAKYAQYRVIVYMATDSKDIYFAPVKINDVTYCGTSTGTDGGITLKGSTAMKWGHTGPEHNSNDPKEGVNYIVSDVLTGDMVNIRAIRAYDAQKTRASIAAIQVVKVGVMSYTATVSQSCKWSEIQWNPSKPASGFGVDDRLTINNTATDATVTIDENIDANNLTVTSASGKNLTLESGSGTLTAKTYDFTGAAGKVTLGYGVDSVTVKAGTDSVVNSVTANTTINIDSGKKLTVKGGTVKMSMVSNSSGTLNFEGGDSSSPIALTADAAVSGVTLGETYVNVTPNIGNTKYNVTGAGAGKSFFRIVKEDKGIGTVEGTQFRNLTLIANVNGAVAYGGFWIERANSVDATVDVVAENTVVLHGYDPTIGTLSGAGTLGKNSAPEIQTLTITPHEDATYSGTTDHNFVIASADGTQTLSGAYTGALTVNSGGKCKLTGSANPSSITDNGTLDIGQKRGLTIGGSGTVDVTLTEQEETQTTAITAFELASGATATVGKVYASDGVTELSVTKNGNKFTINFAAKIGETGYLTLAKAIEAASGTCTITLLADATLPEEAALNANATLVCGDFAISGEGSINVASGSSLSIAAGVIGVTLGGEGSFNLTGGFYKSNKVTLTGNYRYVELSVKPTKGCNYEIIAGSTPHPGVEDEKVYAAGDKGTIVVSESDLVSRGYTIPEGGVQALLNGTGDNGVPNWKNVVLNLKTDDATSFPIVAAQAASSATQIAFKLGGVTVDTASGATVTYKVMTKGSTGEWTTQPTEYAHGATATVNLPTSGVQYYKFDVIVTPAK